MPVERGDMLLAELGHFRCSQWIGAMPDPVAALAGDALEGEQEAGEPKRYDTSGQ